jgi:hypothetical protein
MTSQGLFRADMTGRIRPIKTGKFLSSLKTGITREIIFSPSLASIVVIKFRPP